jgi:hypothetical protein
MIGLSRICLGVHTFFQVLSGWIFGIFLVAVIFAIETKMARWVRQKSVYQLLALIFSISIITFIIIFQLNKASMSFVDFLWQSELSLVFGLFHGLAVGGILSFKQKLDLVLLPPSLKKNAAKLALLFMTIVAFFTTLFISEKFGNKIMACSFVYFESFLLGIWVLYIAPMIF